MSFFSAIKNAFGFGPEEEYISDPETSDDPESNDEQTSSTPQTATAVEGLTEVPTLPEVDPAMKARIFDGAVAIFNEALPGFLSSTTDPKAQSTKLAEAIDKGVDDYLNGLMLMAEQYAEAKLKNATETARRESEKLKADMQTIEQQRTSLREQQLSADRRRRALADRVNDLEAQLAKTEAEREQFELENRSLLNKLKVADIQPGVVDEMAHEIEQLKAQLAAGATSPQETGIDPKELQEANDKAAALASELADLKTQQEMAQTMYNDLQNNYGKERDERIKAEEELAEAKKIVESVAEIQVQMSQVEEVIRKRDERIEKLKASNRKLREQLEQARKDAENARHNDNGLFGMSEPETEYSRIEQTSAAINETLSKDDMSAIEDEFECPDWFVSQPAPGEVSPLLQPDPEFGYQEPPRKPKKPESDAQLSLF